LATILVGDDPSSKIYVNMNADKEVFGILPRHPVPPLLRDGKKGNKLLRVTQQ
jgi:5,10-methylene-tetrahydrofolate dehydrogenase/methenyl tetrahydrofolate cyclohydrolase